MRAVVITPTTGIPELADAIRSVGQQTMKVDHYVVVDGMEHAAKALEICKANDYGQKLIVLPENTGRPKQHFLGEGRQYNGHRIYGAMSFLVNHDYVMLLDEDNWYEPEHCESLVTHTNMMQAKWGYSLRNIMGWDGTFLHRDDCDSLGVYPNWRNIPFVDMNCYCFTGDFFAELAPWFYSELYADKSIFQVAVARVERHYQICSTGLYTVNYRARPDVAADWFTDGMQQIKKQYGDNKPWSREWLNK